MTQPIGRGRVTMYMHNFAPHPATSAFEDSGGGADWDTESVYSFIVVAWYTPEETNVYNAGAINFGYAASLDSLAYESHSAWNGKRPDNADDEFIINWTAPDGETPHHYSVYYQEDTSYDIAAPGTKLNDADISPSLTTYTVSSPGDESSNVQTPIITENVAPIGYTVTETGGVVWTCRATGSFDAWAASTSYAVGDEIYAGGNHWECTTGGTSHSSAPTWYDPASVAIMGNQLVSCGAGSSLVVGSAGTLTVSKSRLIRRGAGLMTEVTFTATAAACAAGENLTMAVGIATFAQTSPIWGSVEVYTLEPVGQLRQEMRGRNYTTYRGHSSRRSLAHDTVVAGVTVTGPGTMCDYYEWVNLSEWMRARATVWLIDRNDDLTDNRYTNHPHYTGKIVGMDYLGSLGKNAIGSFGLAFEVENDDPQLEYYTFDS